MPTGDEGRDGEPAAASPISTRATPAATRRAPWPPVPSRLAPGFALPTAAGITLLVLGAVFVVRFWQPTPGPFVANVRFPYGSQLNAWAVSFGFAWIAYGLLFAAVASASARIPSRAAWWALLLTWLACWFPPALIAVATLGSGIDPRSISTYHAWAATPRGAVVLGLEGAPLVAHVVASGPGFGRSARPLFRTQKFT